MGEVPVPRIETDEDLEKLLASLLCAVRVGSETNSGADFRAHHETCDWCRAYVVQYREAKKYSTGGDVIHMPYNEDEEDDF